MTDPFLSVDRWRTELRGRLLLARKRGDACSVSAVRSAMSAIDNAETPGGPVPSAGAIADSATGLGAAEVGRRALREEDIRGVIRAEIDDRHGAAEQFIAAGHPDRAAALHAEADVLAALLDEV